MWAAVQSPLLIVGHSSLWGYGLVEGGKNQVNFFLLWLLWWKFLVHMALFQCPVQMVIMVIWSTLCWVSVNWLLQYFVNCSSATYKSGLELTAWQLIDMNEMSGSQVCIDFPRDLDPLKLALVYIQRFVWLYRNFFYPRITYKPVFTQEKRKEGKKGGSYPWGTISFNCLIYLARYIFSNIHADYGDSSGNCQILML